MKINVTSISQIETKYEMRQAPSFLVDVYLTEYQMEQLFWQLWEDVGDETLNSWLNREDKQMIPKD